LPPLRIEIVLVPPLLFHNPNTSSTPYKVTLDCAAAPCAAHNIAAAQILVLTKRMCVSSTVLPHPANADKRLPARRVVVIGARMMLHRV
jgi:hypothetical protein